MTAADGGEGRGMRTWTVETGDLRTEVDAPTAMEAYDVFRAEPLRAFGIVVTATPKGGDEGDVVGVRSAHLMGKRWNRRFDAYTIIMRVIAAGGPDTSGAAGSRLSEPSPSSTAPHPPSSHVCVTSSYRPFGAGRRNPASS
jgi:hypothetical protein